MKYTKMKFGQPITMLRVFAFSMVVLFFTSTTFAQSRDEANAVGSTDKFKLFSDQLPSGAQWTGEKQFEREGGVSISGTKDKYIYVRSSESPAEMTGLSIPIRENPGPGEYRYITFAWIKWGGGQIGIQLGYKVSSIFPNQVGKKYNYTYVAGEGDAISDGFMLSDKIPGNWIVTTRDLWKDFGDFTLTGVSFICPTRRDAGFDAILLGKSPDAFEFAPGVLPTEIADPIAVEGEDDLSLSETSEEDASDQTQKVEIDWAAQVKAGGVWMYPLYMLGLLSIVIAIQRMLTAREARLAPKQLRSAVRDSISRGDTDAAIAACDSYPSTLAESLRFIFRYRDAGRETVSQTAGDIAARDIREHLSRIYPLSVIASLAPLLGLLGTIVGMIEAFGLVALYGDEGGAAILSDSISKALITTAAGLIVAMPSIAVYFTIRKRIMSLAAVIEVEIENVITVLYLNDNPATLTTSKKKEDHYAPFN